MSVCVFWAASKLGLCTASRQTFISHLPPPLIMTYASLWIIPLLAIIYLLVVYGVLLLAKRASSSRRTEG